MFFLWGGGKKKKNIHVFSVRMVLSQDQNRARTPHKPPTKRIGMTTVAISEPQASEKLLKDVVDDDEDSDDDDDDAGSLVDFVVNDDNDDTASIASDASEGPKTKTEEVARDLEDINPNNVVLGKRVRKQTNFYDREVFASPEYRKMALEDVPSDEIDAVLGESSDEEDVEDEDDASFDPGEEDNEEEEDGASDEEEQGPGVDEEEKEPGVNEEE